MYTNEMSNLDAAVLAADNLCKSLESLLATEQKFCSDIYLDLEKLNWEIYKNSNQLKELKEFIGG